MTTTHTTTSIEHAMTLAVSLAGRSINIGAGPLLVGGQPHAFPADSVEIEVRAFPTAVFGFLVHDTQEGGIQLLLDEHIGDGVDLPWEPQRGDRYQPWALLFQIVVPAGGDALNPDDLHVWRMITPAQKAAEEGQG